MLHRLNPHYILNKLYYLYMFRQLRGGVDISSKIRGKKHMQVGKNFAAGKHLWLEAVSEYKGQKFHPTIVIKDNVSMSDFNHIGAVNYIEIGNNVLFGSKCYVTDHNHGIYSRGGRAARMFLRRSGR